jgi:hypothetical protein
VSVAESEMQARLPLGQMTVLQTVRLSLLGFRLMLRLFLQTLRTPVFKWISLYFCIDCCAWL